jgi:hypothetical protein
MPGVGFESMILVFEQPNTAHASDCLAIGTGIIHLLKVNYLGIFLSEVPFS